MGKSTGWQQAMESADQELDNKLPLCSWHSVTYADGKWHDEEGELPAELA